MRTYKFIDLTDQKFGKLTAIRPTDERRFTCVVWECICDCGKTLRVDGNHLRTGHTKSCGCVTISRVILGNKARAKHNSYKTATYRSWRSMINRCENPKHEQYVRYGARGISICVRWHNSFKLFLEDMGERPPNTTIDRINNSGNYTPDNCRWATSQIQMRNMRRNKYLTFNGETLCLTEWAERLGGKDNSLSSRLERGWSVERALSTPFQKYKKNRASRQIS